MPFGGRIVNGGICHSDSTLFCVKRGFKMHLTFQWVGPPVLKSQSQTLLKTPGEALTQHERKKASFIGQFLCLLAI